MDSKNETAKMISNILYPQKKPYVPPKKKMEQIFDIKQKLKKR